MLQINEVIPPKRKLVVIEVGEGRETMFYPRDGDGGRKRARS